jgi:hypothetical protein
MPKAKKIADYRIAFNPHNRRQSLEREAKMKLIEAMLTDKPSIAMDITEHFKLKFQNTSQLLLELQKQGRAKAVSGRAYKSGKAKFYFHATTPDSVIAEFKKLNQTAPFEAKPPKEKPPAPAMPEYLTPTLACWMGYTDIQPPKGEHYAEKNIPQPLRKAENRGIGSGMAMMELAA